MTPQFQDVNHAFDRIKDMVHRTPVITSSYLNELSGAKLFFKCENFQKVGAFKFRGASNAVYSMSYDKVRNGVSTHSSGNHAQALALAASMRAVPAHIVMPKNSPKVKINAVIDYGAEVHLCEPTLDARESKLQEVVDEYGTVFIHPYDDFNIICGQGTSAFELLMEHSDLDAVFTPVGGGGLLSGTAIASKGLSSKVKVYAAEPEGADDAYRSFKGKKHIPQENPDTICDGLLTSIGELNYKVIIENVDDIFTVNDKEVINALRLIWERMKIIVEPSCATVLAAVLKNKEKFEGQKIGLILSGGNVDLKKVLEMI